MRAEALGICREKEGMMVNPLFLAIDMHESSDVRVIGSSEDVCCLKVEVLAEKVEGALEVADQQAIVSQLEDRRWLLLESERSLCISMKVCGAAWDGS